MSKYKIAVIEGDGTGPEVIGCALRVLKSTGLDAEFIPIEAGYWAYQKFGKQVTDSAWEIIHESNCILKGPTTTPTGGGETRMKSVAVMLRQKLDLYANVRPCKSRAGVPVPTKFTDLDFVIVRENTEGLYKGIEYEMSEDEVVSLRVFTRKGCERISRFGFELARREKRKKVTLITKANILQITDGFFTNIFNKVAENYPDLEHEDIFVDRANMYMITRPDYFDVIVTSNLFGDVLSDAAAGLMGGLGLAPGANMGDSFAMFEAVHGSAPRYAGQNKVNPTAMILSAVMMLKYLGENKIAEKVEKAVDKVLLEGATNKEIVTYDLDGTATNIKMTDEIVKRME
ncbi:MAG: isocitrate/isopropylmalate dehydrogenase family protein [Candidatus Jordarchaeum sp.]|uniref:isocitrate/isopropylmalate dehydrogenase family protein n=1 Tax=Candidatus Jordarchaeum sp. TaxID=2823881 RepID=UPI00404A1F8D